MIQILTPDDTKAGPSRAFEEQRGRVRALGDEETRLALSVNDLRETERTERERIDAETQKLRNNFTAERVSLELDIKRLVDARAPLLVPIEELRKEAEDRNARSKERESAVSAREAAVLAREQGMKEADEALAERLEAVADKEQETNERDEKSVEREKKAAQVEEQATASLRRANEKWTAFNLAADAKEKKIAEREAAVIMGEKANSARAAELDKQAKKNDEKQRELQSNYQALAQAKEHLGIK